MYGLSPHGPKMAAAAQDITFSQYVLKVRNQGMAETVRESSRRVPSFFFQERRHFPLLTFPYDSLGHMITRVQSRLEIQVPGKKARKEGVRNGH